MPPKPTIPQPEALPEAPICPHCAEKPRCRAAAVARRDGKLVQVVWRCPLCGQNPDAKPEPEPEA